MISNLLTVAVLALVGTRLVSAARVAVTGPAREHIRFILGHLRLRHFVRAPLVFAAVIAVAVPLYAAVPPLRFGWWTAIGGTGNIVTGGTSRTAGTPLEWIVPTIFLLLIVPALPLFAEREEIVFRRGAEHWDLRRRIWQGLKFGLVHLIMGIPIAFALALSLGGWYFMWAYLRGYRAAGGDEAAGVLESTCSHLAYNMEIFGVAAIALAVSGSLR